MQTAADCILSIETMNRNAFLSVALPYLPNGSKVSLPERDYVTFGSLLSQIRLSVVCNVRVPYSGVEALGNVSSPLCTLAVYLNHPLTSV